MTEFQCYCHWRPHQKNEQYFHYTFHGNEIFSGRRSIQWLPSKCCLIHLQENQFSMMKCVGPTCDKAQSMYSAPFLIISLSMVNCLYLCNELTTYVRRLQVSARFMESSNPGFVNVTVHLFVRWNCDGRLGIFSFLCRFWDLNLNNIWA